MPLSYPVARRLDLVEELHGVPVADPYRWLEEDSPETRSFIEAQNRLSRFFLDQLPLRSKLRARLQELWNYPKVSPPRPRGGRYFTLRNPGLANQPILYVGRRWDEHEVLLDPNALSTEGSVALMDWAPSPDGRWLAYALSQGGSDWLEWRIRSVERREDLPERLSWCKFGQVAWLPDGSGFFYPRFPAPQGGLLTEANYDQAVYFHRLGTPQETDLPVFAGEPEWTYQPQVSSDGRYLLLEVSRGTFAETLILIKDLSLPGDFQPLTEAFQAEYTLIGSQGGRVYLKTTAQAPQGRVIAIEVGGSSREIIPEHEESLLSAAWSQGTLLAVYSQHAAHRVERWSLEGEPQGTLPLPPLSTVSQLEADPSEQEFFLGVSSFVLPQQIFRGTQDSFQEIERVNPAGFDPAAYTVRQAFVTSRDGTKVPLFLIHSRELASGPHPTLLYGYGGFRISLGPSFHPSWLAWLEAGGIIAQASLRGGGEYGEAWYRAGTLERKQNVFDDFIACAEWLIEEGLTEPARLAIQGASNGGLLVGAAMTQRPELFGAALPAVGVLDVLRFHKFTIGWAWVSDYGSPEDPEAFRVLYRYSPYHNIRPGVCYPATLITTGDHDDRVVPAHSFKFAAALQAAQSCDRPILLRVETKTGHGAGKPTEAALDEAADVYAFALWAVGAA
jgi:prolyl oligopeptidase